MKNLNNFKILLISSPYNKMASTDNLISLTYLQASLLVNGYNCDVLDPKTNDISIEDIVSRALEYDLIGISFYSHTANNAISIANGIKCKKNIPIVLGGLYATIYHNIIIQDHNCFDCIVRGEGEEVIIKLVEDYFSNNKFTIPLPGVSYRDLNGSKVLSDTILNIEDLDSLPFPERLIPPKNFNGIYNTYISFSRGCPYKCNYCLSHNMRDKRRLRSVDNIVDELIYIKNKIPVEHIYITICDEDFLLDYNRIKDVINKFKSICGEFNFRFFGFSRPTTINNVDSDSLFFFKNNGLVEISIGLENGSQSVLDRWDRKLTVEDNLKCIKYLNSLEIPYGINFMLFDSYTTIDELKENIEFIKLSNLWGWYQSEILTLYRNYNKWPESAGSMSNTYFKCNEIYIIYQYMNSFYKMYFNKIHKDIRNLHLYNKMKQTKLFILFELPYILLELLINNLENIDNIYNDFLIKYDFIKKLDNRCDYE